MIRSGEEVWLAYAERCYETGRRILERHKTNITDPILIDPKILSVLLLTRTCSNFQGVIALARLGLVVEARILARCCLENQFTAVLLSENGPSFIRKLVDDDEATRKSRGEFLLKHTRHEDDYLRSLLRNLKKSKRRTLSPKRMADAAGPIGKGYAFYAQMSADAAHPTVESLTRYISANQSKRDEIWTTVNMACEALIGVITFVDGIFDGVADPDLTNLIQEMGRQAAHEPRSEK
ncbi:MAG: hypothetical protein JO038_00425 [Alphaproteobacteria bacterium]|nr:hypothetical protein [Alphaproteobacteria bacterium]